jgi:V/A-type H+-transporting ATPase subunit K
MVEPMVAAAAAASIIFTGMAAAYAIAATGTASIGALVEKPELFGKTMVYVAFAEAIAIYGLLIALMLVLGIGG